ncbi:MAG: pyridoxal phosphate-dependent aminotransferase [Rhodanobacteraceae bacterium]|nr:pyridoxal phosphate-dependent aminotransferase [Rhodanobacteraceae bacterium]MBL0041861.1 pyridoxal phosphate-dependent aminotransferase [Xanthomonadales bacterium]MBP6078377.1 pyridoxal phosphate-dependent aminotransferase [Xanthomonadales bacterium]
MLKLAERMGRAKPSAIMVVAEKAKKLKAEGRDIISFSIGVPNFLPGEHVYAAAREALAKDSGSYGSNRGPDALLDAFLKHLRAGGLDGYERSNIVSGVGAKHVLYNVMYALLDEGDEILIPTPYWTSYVDIADILGAKSTLLYCGPEQNYKLTPDQLREALKSKPKAILFNNPSNPTGMVYDHAEVRALADVLVDAPDTWIISDDIYNRMIFDGLGYAHLVKARPELRDRTLLLDSVSKTYGMPGWRVGMVAAPSAAAQALVNLNSNAITNLPEVVNAAAIAAFSGPQDVPETKCREFQGKRDQVMAALAAIPGVNCPKPQGAFYVFPDISCAFGKTHNGKRIDNDVDLCNALLDAKGVACVPGSAFGEPRAIRISYTCPTAQLPDGLKRIQDFFAEMA